MRSYAGLVIALGVVHAGCYRESAPAPAPHIRIAAASESRAVDDELAFLPADSEIVIGIDVGRLRGTALWDEQLAPLAARSQGLARLQQHCRVDPLRTLGLVTTGLKLVGDAGHGVAVVRGGDAPKVLDCMARLGGAVQRDGVHVFDRDRTKIAARDLGRGSVVMLAGAPVDRAGLDAAIASGAPLRASPAFLRLYQRREPGAAVWFMLNGSSPMFRSLAGAGFAPSAIDGTLAVGESYVLVVRIGMRSEQDADRLVTTVQGSLGAARAMVQSLEVAADGALVRLELVVTAAQAQTLVAMLGLAIP